MDQHVEECSCRGARLPIPQRQLVQGTVQAQPTRRYLYQCAARQFQRDAQTRNYRQPQPLILREPGSGTREIVEGSYIVVYRYDPSPDQIIVLSVRHGARRR